MIGDVLIATEIKVEEDDLEFQGIVASFSATQLVLEEFATPFLIDEGITEIDGILFAGAEVEVEAVILGGVLTATEIKVEEEEEQEFEGTITGVSDTLVEVDGVRVPETIELDGTVTIRITSGTEIDGILFAGAEVEVEAVMLGASSLPSRSR